MVASFFVLEKATYGPDHAGEETAKGGLQCNAAQGKLASMSWVPRRNRCRLSLLVLSRKMATLVSFLCHLKAHLPLLYPAPNMLHD